MKFEYLLFNLIILSSQFLAKFLYPQSVLPKGKNTFVSILIPAVIFIIWDMLVTGYFWRFNHDYVLGINIMGVPIEECLFFLTVPYACFFIWKNFKISETKIVLLNKLQLPFALLIFLSGSNFLVKGVYYTGTDLIVFSLVMLVDIIVGAKIVFTKKMIFFVPIVLFLTFIFNYYLTARPIVLYENSLKTNINILTIPVEDFLYGLSLIMMQIIFYKTLSSQARQLPHKQPLFR